MRPHPSHPRYHCAHPTDQIGKALNELAQLGKTNATVVPYLANVLETRRANVDLPGCHQERMIMIALALTGDQRVLSVLEKQLMRTDDRTTKIWEIWKAAAFALGQTKNPRAVDILKKGIEAKHAANECQESIKKLNHYSAVVEVAPLPVFTSTATMTQDDARAHYCLNRLGEYLLIQNGGYAEAVTRLGFMSPGISYQSDLPVDVKMRVADELIVCGAVLLTVYTRRFFLRRKLFSNELDRDGWTKFCASVEHGLDAWTSRATLSDIFRAYCKDIGPIYRGSGVMGPSASPMVQRRLHLRLKRVFNDFPGAFCTEALTYELPDRLSAVIAKIANEEFAG